MVSGPYVGDDEGKSDGAAVNCLFCTESGQSPTHEKLLALGALISAASQSSMVVQETEQSPVPQ